MTLLIVAFIWLGMVCVLGSEIYEYETKTGRYAEEEQDD